MNKIIDVIARAERFPIQKVQEPGSLLIVDTLFIVLVYGSTTLTSFLSAPYDCGKKQTNK